VSEWVSGRRFGSVHPDRHGCLEGAGDQEERALEIGEAALGPDHPTVAALRDNLSGVLQAPQDATAEGPALGCLASLLHWGHVANGQSCRTDAETPVILRHPLEHMRCAVNRSQNPIRRFLQR
jgi:hypothetical protein